MNLHVRPAIRRALDVTLRFAFIVAAIVAGLAIEHNLEPPQRLNVHVTVDVDPPLRACLRSTPGCPPTTTTPESRP